MQRDPILICLSPSAIRVAVLSGSEIARVERVALDPDSFEAAWKKNLTPLDDALRTAVNALGIRPGASAHVIYHGPHSVAEVFQAPATGQAAVKAADLYLQQTLPNVSGGWLTTRQVLAEIADTSSTAGASGSRTLMLTVADSASDGDTLSHWLRRSGLRAEGILPAKAAMLHQSMTSDPMSASAQPRVYVHLGEHAMTIAGWVDGRLALARCAEVGYALLCDAVYRSGRGQQLGDVFTRDYATRLAFSVGLPMRGEMMDQGLNFKAEAVLPLVQPALQRFAIELRQTLRFGMLESDLAKVKLWVRGPGAAVPGLCQALGDALELPSECLAGRAGGGIAEDQVGDLTVAVALRNEAIWMTPPSMQVQRIARASTRALRTGVAAACVALAGMAGYAHVRTASLEAELADLRPRVEEVESREDSIRALSAATARSDMLERMLATSMGQRPRWRAPLTLLTTATDAGVELLDITGGYGSDTRNAPIMELRGRAPANDTGADPILELVTRLRAEPYVESARVVSTRTETEDSESREFVVSVQLRGLGMRVPQLTDAQAMRGEQP